MNRFLYTLLLLLLASLVHAQNTKKQKLDFVEHLVNSTYYEEAIHEITRLERDNFQNRASDSLNYFKGWSLYSMKKLDTSAEALLKVNIESEFYPKSQFFAAYNNTHLGNYSEAKEIFANTLIKSPELVQLKHFELSGIALLERDVASYEQQRKAMESDLFVIATEKKKLDQYALQLKDYKPKKPWVAGLMSAIIPGSGKIYAGKTGEGIASMLMVSSMGLVTWENYRKAGHKNYKTILFGSIFTIFYVGNIYGSVFSVKIKNEEFNHEMDQRILFNLHIPLRNFFN